MQKEKEREREREENTTLSSKKVRIPPPDGTKKV